MILQNLMLPRYPVHMRRLLLARKTVHTQKALRRYGIGPNAHGLDIGCGQGWYAEEMARTGSCVVAIDSSRNQLKQAGNGGDGNVLLCCGDGSALPIRDDTVDYAYAINALHHVTNEIDQLRVLSEVVRVLKPGGIFLLHEINIRNPLFKFYITFIFPLISEIDEGNELYISTASLPPAEGAAWDRKVDYFTFAPDWIPERFFLMLRHVESWLERSVLRAGSAHFLATLVKPQNGDRETKQ